MSIQNRIIEYIRHSNLTNRAFEQRCSLSNGYINNIKKGIGVDKLSYISANYPDLNIGWLISGEGSMIKNPQTTNPPLNQDNTMLDKLLAMLDEKDRQIAKKDEQIKQKDEQINVLLNLLQAKDNKKGGRSLQITHHPQVKGI